MFVKRFILRSSLVKTGWNNAWLDPPAHIMKRRWKTKVKPSKESPEHGILCPATDSTQSNKICDLCRNIDDCDSYFNTIPTVNRQIVLSKKRTKVWFFVYPPTPWLRVQIDTTTTISDFYMSYIYISYSVIYCATHFSTSRKRKSSVIGTITKSSVP